MTTEEATRQMQAAAISPAPTGLTLEALAEQFAALSASQAETVQRLNKLDDLHDANAVAIDANTSDVALLKADMATIAGSIGAITRGDYAGAGLEVVGHWGAIVESAHRVEMLINRFWPSLFPPRVNELPPPVNLQQTTEAAQDARKG